jgi:hypothetical protein
MGKTAQEVGRAVERIDDEGLPALAHRAGFLGEDGDVGIGPAQLADDLGLGERIHFAGVVLAVLLEDVKAVELAHVAQEHGAGLAGRLDHDVDDRVLHGSACYPLSCMKNVPGQARAGRMIPEGARSGPAPFLPQSSQCRRDRD